MGASKKNARDLINRYLRLKSMFNVRDRYFDIFEYRHGVTDGVSHTLAETGKRFGISGTRVDQIEARVLYEIEQRNGNRPE